MKENNKFLLSIVLGVVLLLGNNYSTYFLANVASRAC
jgi:hypothetical protein